MRILEDNWKVLTSFFPKEWQQMVWQSGAVERLRGFSSPDAAEAHCRRTDRDANHLHNGTRRHTDVGWCNEGGRGRVPDQALQ